MKTAAFMLDALGEQTFEGFTNGELWNGFDCPYLTFDTAMRLVEAWRAQGWGAHYDEAADSFVFSVGHNFETNEPDDEEAFSAVEPDGRKLYPIGACVWIWEEAQHQQASHDSIPRALSGAAVQSL